MCTVTWWNHPGGFAVFFNRDERGLRLAIPGFCEKVANGAVLTSFRGLALLVSVTPDRHERERSPQNSRSKPIFRKSDE